MNNRFNLSRVLACTITLCVLFVSACGRTPVDAFVPGSRTLEANELTARYAGKSVRMNAQSGAANDYLEMYFDKDGSFHAVATADDYIMDGTWAVNAGVGASANINLRIVSSVISDGQAYRGDPELMTMFVYVLPDDTASVFSRDSSTTYVYRQPKPTPGFQNRARFNSINRKISNALGS